MVIFEVLGSTIKVLYEMVIIFQVTSSVWDAPQNGEKAFVALIFITILERVARYACKKVISKVQSEFSKF